MDRAWLLTWLALLAVLSGAVGGVAGVFWSRLSVLPSYTIRADGSAVMTGEGLASFVSADAWFAVIGIVAGLAVGTVTWLWLKLIGWPVSFVAVGASLLAGTVALFVGHLLGPGPLDVRIAAAMPGDHVPLDLKLTSLTALVTWPFGALAPTLFAAALGPEIFHRSEELPRWRRARREGPEAEAPRSEEDTERVPASDGLR